MLGAFQILRDACGAEGPEFCCDTKKIVQMQSQRGGGSKIEKFASRNF